MDFELCMTDTGVICQTCACKNECAYYEAIHKIEDLVVCGLGTDTELGLAIARAMDNHKLTECEYYEKA